jgi:hypothetical protein
MTPEMRGWRRWTWVMVGWSIGAVVLALLALGAVGDACGAMEGIGLTVCRTGAAIGAFAVLFIVFWAWLIGFLLLVVGWFARRPKRRLCPPYGHPVDEGRTTCPACGYDFVAGTLPATPRPGTTPPPA